MQRKQLNERSAQRLHLLLKLKFSGSEIMHKIIINFESSEILIWDLEIITGWFIMSML